MKKLLIIVLLFVGYGCYSSSSNIPYYSSSNYQRPLTEKEIFQKELNKLRNNVYGKHYSVIIEDLGAYTRKVEDGKGGSIFIWEQHTEEKVTKSWEYNENFGVYDDQLIKDTYDYHNAHSEEMQVFCDAKGIIYRLDVKFN